MANGPQQVNAVYSVFSCPLTQPKVMAGLDVERYKGKWYEIQRDKENWLEKDMMCVFSDILDTPFRSKRDNRFDSLFGWMAPDQGTKQMAMPWQEKDLYCYEQEDYTGFFVADRWMQNIEDPDTLEVNLKVFQERYGIEFLNGDDRQGRTTYRDGYTNYNILHTDYDNYAVVYSCDNWLNGLYHSQHAWILSRVPYMKPKYFEEAHAVLKNAVGDSYDKDVNLVFSGKDCGWEKCSTDSIIDLGAADPSKAIYDVVVKVNNYPTQVKVEQFRSNSCAVEYTLYHNLGGKWLTLDSSPLKWFIKFDPIDLIITYKALKDNKLLGDFNLVLAVSSDLDVMKHKEFQVTILPDCSIEKLYDTSLRTPKNRVPQSLRYQLVDPDTEYYTLTRQFKSSASFCPLESVVEFKDTIN